jgi:hypothetical protein
MSSPSVPQHAARARLKRELSDEAVQHQAEQLLEYAARGGAVSLWLDSKDFAAGDRAAVLWAWALLDEACA